MSSLSGCAVLNFLPAVCLRSHSPYGPPLSQFHPPATTQTSILSLLISPSKSLTSTPLQDLLLSIQLFCNLSTMLIRLILLRTYALYLVYNLKGTRLILKERKMKLAIVKISSALFNAACLSASSFDGGQDKCGGF